MLAVSGVGAVAHPRPSVVSAGMCADQLVLSVAVQPQEITLTRAAAEPELSAYLHRLEGKKIRTLSSERLLFETPDIVVVDEYTPALNKQMYRLLDLRVFEIPPLRTFEEVRLWQEKLAEALEQPRPKRMEIPIQQAPNGRSAVVFRPGGYSPGIGTSVDYILSLAGYTNLSRRLGLNGTRSISLETIVYHHPDLLITDATLQGNYALGLAPLALSHPVIAPRLEQAQYIPLAQWFCLTPRSAEAYKTISRF